MGRKEAEAVLARRKRIIEGSISAPHSELFVVFCIVEYGGTVLQVGRSWVQFPMMSLEFFIYKILPATL